MRFGYYPAFQKETKEERRLRFKRPSQMKKKQPNKNTATTAAASTTTTTKEPSLRLGVGVDRRMGRRRRRRRRDVRTATDDDVFVRKVPDDGSVESHVGRRHAILAQREPTEGWNAQQQQTLSDHQVFESVVPNLVWVVTPQNATPKPLPPAAILLCKRRVGMPFKIIWWRP